MKKLEVAYNLKIAFIGNPNVGKTTLFNQITGLRQKVGNYPGVTVDKKIGYFQSAEMSSPITIIDLPGTYSLYPRSEDELIVHRVLNGLSNEGKPDAVLAVVDMANLERGLFLVSQIMDLGLPVALVLNMKDVAENKGITVNTFKLYKAAGIPVIQTNAREKKGLDAVYQALRENSFKKTPFLPTDIDLIPTDLAQKIQQRFELDNAYQSYQLLRFAEHETLLSKEDKTWLQDLVAESGYDLLHAQREESDLRYKQINNILNGCIERKNIAQKNVTSRLDKIFLHPVGGYFIFFATLFLIFQAIFTWAEWPMNLIDGLFAVLSEGARSIFPAGALTDLLADGLIPGIGGVAIFVPQIALLFGFLAILEDSGYMARAVFLTDRLMRPFGLNGKSIVPLMSGMACAIPAVMAARNIGNYKDRLITILVTPLMSCSARLPVYVILIGLVIPDETFGPFNYQGLALMGMYLLGTFAALISAWLMKLIIKAQNKGFLVIELPIYRWPGIKDVLLTMYLKSRTFVLETAKIIVSISVILWVLASYGPVEKMEMAEKSVNIPEIVTAESHSEYQNEIASAKLQASYAGHLGRLLEPVIAPLGYDWKIGIALITSFAAREVFVATISTLYSIGEDTEDTLTIKQRLEKQVDPNTGQKVFRPEVGLSLLMFYAFAMQCMSTMAIVKRETKTWKWAFIQFVYMTALAYISAYMVYNIFS